MQASSVGPAVSAATSCAIELGLSVDNAIILQDSNRLALRLIPCDVFARVAPVSYRASAEFEVEVARRLAEAGAPVAALEPRVEPRVYARDGFVINMWTYYEASSPRDVPPAEYAQALERLHAGMRQIGIDAPHFSDRVAEARHLIDHPDQTPDLAQPDRELLSSTLRELSSAIGQRGAAEQLLHGEPHPGNILTTRNGLRFIDFETCCRGPVEFDLAHLPEELGEHYPGADQELVRECRTLILAMVAAWRWDRNDRYPNGRQMGTALITELRAAVGRTNR